jgi:hypothetical protein
MENPHDFIGSLIIHESWGGIVADSLLARFWMVVSPAAEREGFSGTGEEACFEKRSFHIAGSVRVSSVGMKPAGRCAL